MTNIGVVLFNLGGPDSLEAIEPFLYNLFSDPDIFNIPIGQKLFAKIISNRRAPKVQEEYKLIGGKSPINEWTELQRDMLERMLNENTDYKFTVITAMRYWKPLIRDIAKEKYSKISTKLLCFHCILIIRLLPQVHRSMNGTVIMKEIIRN